MLCLSSDSHASPKPARAVTSKYSLGTTFLEEAVLIEIHDYENCCAPEPSLLASTKLSREREQEWKLLATVIVHVLAFGPVNYLFS